MREELFRRSKLSWESSRDTLTEIIREESDSEEEVSEQEISEEESEEESG